LALTSLGHFINDGTTYLVPVVADFLSLSYHASPLWVTAMLTLYYVASSITSMAVGRFADRYGRHGSLIAQGMLLMSLGLIGYYAAIKAAPNYLLLPLTLASSVLIGFGSSFYHPIGATMLSQSFGEKNKGRALGINGAMGSLGRALYPSMYFAVATLLTKPGSIAFSGFVGIAAAAGIYQNFKAERMNVNPRVGRPLSLRGALTKGIVVLTVVSFIRSTAIQAVVSWMPIYFTYDKGLGFSATLGAAITIMYAAGIVGQPSFGLFVERFDKRYVIAASFLGTSLALLGYLYTRGVISYLLLFVFGFATFSGFPVFLSLATDYSPPEYSTFGNSLVWGLGITGGGTLGPIIPALISRGNYARLPYAFEILAVVNLAITAGLLLLPKSSHATKQK
jgi:FSR family fosmidomycin resistance protein-like MFS transporter